jgi:hypothetical protein
VRALIPRLASLPLVTLGLLLRIRPIILALGLAFAWVSLPSAEARADNTNYAALSDRTVCSVAITGSRAPHSEWSPHHTEEIEEAKRRGFTPEYCSCLLMVSANHMSIDVCHPKSAPVQPRSSATPAAKPPLPLEKKKIGDVRLTPTWTKEEQAAAAALVVSLTALGLTSLAALLLQIRAGYPRSQALADLLNALKGRFPPDPFEAWKRKYTSLGWRYAESGGVAHFDPVAGSRNEQGWIYDAEQGTFVPPGTPRTPLAPHDGQVDPVTGKVWSSNGREWQSRSCS